MFPTYCKALTFNWCVSIFKHTIHRKDLATFVVRNQCSSSHPFFFTTFHHAGLVFLECLAILIYFFKLGLRLMLFIECFLYTLHAKYCKVKHANGWSSKTIVMSYSRTRPFTSIQCIAPTAYIFKYVVQTTWQCPVWRSKIRWSIFGQEWAKHTGTRKDEIAIGGRTEYTTWKTRLRSAINKAPDIETMKDSRYQSTSSTDEPFKVFKFKPVSSMRKHGKCL